MLSRVFVRRRIVLRRLIIVCSKNVISVKLL